ncbi:MAG: hypothetical protein ABI234_03820 [Ktedonobacteraceae bacterium]
MNRLKKPAFIIVAMVFVVGLILATFAYHAVTSSGVQATTTATTTVRKAATPTPTVKAATLLPPQQPAQIQGISGDDNDIATHYKGISWVRLGYPSCGWGNLRGDVLKNAMETEHSQGIRVLFVICQGADNAQLTDANAVSAFDDVAQSNPDAVQCGNEEMKQDPSVAFLHIAPANFAKFYDLCETSIHKVRADIPVLLGSLDPHVSGIDHQAFLGQVNYLNQMQAAMNSSVHPGGNWDWHTQTLGLIDSWHNGYPNASVNNLSHIFAFWAQQFHVDPNSGALGKHLWVVEGTGCFQGCGINANSAYQVAVSHVLTLITDVQTSMSASVPFFFFSDKDFADQGVHWPIGIADSAGNIKPIRQDLSMGARTLNLSCPNGNVSVVDQEQLLSSLYNHCTLPGNYLSVLES